MLILSSFLWPLLEEDDPKDEKSARCVKKIRVSERSEFRIFSNVLIFQVFWKHWPRLFGYFCGNDKSIKLAQTPLAVHHSAKLGLIPPIHRVQIMTSGRNYKTNIENICNSRAIWQYIFFLEASLSSFLLHKEGVMFLCLVS